MSNLTDDALWDVCLCVPVCLHICVRMVVKRARRAGTKQTQGTWLQFFQSLTEMAGSYNILVFVICKRFY